jgi:phage baseplate assembly protein W|tara:strand:+ start:567 stop:1004 length:438 start_codon:yes stop_codon:yes gene_type:complete
MARQLSIEDGNLASSVLTSRIKKYSDIDLLFDKKPSGDIYKKQEAAAVKQAVKNIVSTNRYEKPFNMNFGSNITGMLFELAHSHMDRSIEQDIRSTLHKYEPRAKILDINIVSNPDAYTLRVRLTFRVMTTGEIIDLETTISRLR